MQQLVNGKTAYPIEHNYDEAIGLLSQVKENSQTSIPYTAYKKAGRGKVQDRGL